MCLVKCQQWQESVFEKEGQASKKLINGLHMSYKKQWFATWSRFSWGLYYYHYSQKSSEQKKHYMTEGTKTCCILPLKKQKLQDSKWELLSRPLCPDYFEGSQYQQTLYHVIGSSCYWQKPSPHPAWFCYWCLCMLLLCLWVGSSHLWLYNRNRMQGSLCITHLI